MIRSITIHTPTDNAHRMYERKGYFLALCRGMLVVTMFKQYSVHKQLHTTREDGTILQECLEIIKCSVFNRTTESYFNEVQRYTTIVHDKNSPGIVKINNSSSFDIVITRAI